MSTAGRGRFDLLVNLGVVGAPLGTEGGVVDAKCLSAVLNDQFRAWGSGGNIIGGLGKLESSALIGYFGISFVFLKYIPSSANWIRSLLFVIDSNIISFLFRNSLGSGLSTNSFIKLLFGILCRPSGVKCEVMELVFPFTSFKAECTKAESVRCRFLIRTSL